LTQHHPQPAEITVLVGFVALIWMQGLLLAYWLLREFISFWL
jgi:hypothetical protein